ncbi:MAG: DUF1579 domain-containing protein [Planctomycetes bacterium]|nr:DUF1579 domain-containing protein [Planctomycetota bacterium]
MPKTEPLDQHKWLQQLVGEWTVEVTTDMGPDVESMKFESTDKVRAIGDIWILAEGGASFGETRFTSIMTLGYDPAKKAFVGSWIDSMTAYMWQYKGQLDDSRKVLTLATEGPQHSDPTKMAQYHDVITIVSADERTLTSSMKGEDGKYKQFMSATYKRKQK